MYTVYMKCRMWQNIGLVSVYVVRDLIRDSNNTRATDSEQQTHTSFPAYVALLSKAKSTLIPILILIKPLCP